MISEEIPLIIGSLIFTNKLNEALKFEKIMTKLHYELSSKQLAMIHLFCVIGYSRVGQYQNARKRLHMLFQLKNSDKKTQYYLYQSLSFYHFIICRYKKAYKYVQRALEYSPEKDELKNFWQIITYDLSAHIFNRNGQYEKSLKSFENALDFSQKTNNEFTTKSILTSLAIIKSNKDINQKASLQNLKKQILSFKKTPQDHFYYFNLNLEYIRRLKLNGELHKSQIILNEIKKKLFKTELNRQKSNWFFQQAHLIYLQGSPEIALHHLESALSLISEHQDLSHRIQILGLQYKIKNQKLFSDHSTDLKNEITNIETELKKLTFYTQDALALNYAYRYGWTQSPPYENSFSTFFFNWSTQQNISLKLIKQVIQNNWLSLFRDKINYQFKTIISFDLIPSQAIIFTSDLISIVNKPTQLIKKAFLALNQYPLYKKDFVYLIWGYDYESYRHDHLIYSLIHRMRDDFKLDTQQLIMSDNLISLNNVTVKSHNISVTTLNTTFNTGPSTHQNKNLNTSLSTNHNTTHSDKLNSNLNARQIEVLLYLNDNKYITVKTLSTHLKINSLMAARDLIDLYKKNLICRWGKGRATSYSLRRG